LKIVLDTNVLLVSISLKSKYRPIFDAFLSEEYELCVTTDILMEYEEIISSHMGKKVA
jgi:rRNA-processing protein FCF1